MITVEKLIEKTKLVINGVRHKYYEHTVQKAAFYKTLVTGLAQEQLIVQYKERETDAQKKQRVHLTHTRTKSAANKVKQMFNRVFEVEKLKDKIDYENANEQKLADLRERIGKFSGKNKSLEKYLNDAALYYNFVDPNAFLLISYTAPTTEEGQITESPFSYPIEIPAVAAADYKYVNGELKYLITCQKTHIAGEVVREYYAYAKGIQLYIVEIIAEVTKTGFYPEGEPDQMFKHADANWAVYETEVVTDEVPAMRFGYMPDYTTNRETFVGVLDSADQEFIDLINRKSEYDISLALHTFLQKFQVANPCEYQDGDYHCLSGTLSVSGEQCPSCHGTGLQVHTTAQQAILVKRPQTKDEWIPLSEMVKYVELPFDIVEHQSKLVEKLPREISVVIFGVDITERPTENVTATAISNYFDSLYAVLGQFADQYSELYTFAATTIAKNAALDEGLTVQHKFPRDFEMLSLGELLGILDAAKKAGAPDEVVSNIEEDIMSKQNQDSPVHLQIFKAKRKFRPFKNIPSQLLQNTLNSLPNTDEFKIRYLYNDIIFDSIMQQNPEFILLPLTQQELLVSAAVQKVREMLTAGEVVTLRTAIQESEGEGGEVAGEIA